MKLYFQHNILRCNFTIKCEVSTNKEEFVTTVNSSVDFQSTRSKIRLDSCDSSKYCLSLVRTIKIKKRICVWIFRIRVCISAERAVHLTYTSSLNGSNGQSSS
jgi:hypothetical protein